MSPSEPNESLTGRDRREELWEKLRNHFKLSQQGRWPEWNALAKAAYDLGYHEYAKAWGYVPPKKSPPERYT